ncbi:MAG: (2Fe-2S)-binding protein [Rhodoblastus sp.]|nr:MAG: (2Fe-2S)-binding protein [Rhodoblastus sp.]
MATLTINGATVELDVEDDTPLLWALRDHLGLTGTKYGCGVGQCGACTVHVDGVAERACSVPVGALSPERRIVTIEGLGAAGEGLGAASLHPVQQAWAELDVAQCGYCQPGMIMAAAALLARSPAPSEAEIRAEIGNICRCGTYQRVLAGVRRAAERMTATRRG